MKPVEAVVAAIKLIQNQIEHYNLKSQYYSGVWPVQNNQTITDTINKINSIRKAVSMSTFDFSALYTNIPNHKLKPVMGEFINTVSMVGMKNSLGALGMGLVELIINKDKDCLY